MSENKVFYMVMTTNYELARELWDAVERNRRHSWWKRVTKYYKGESKEPYYETTDSSS
jgi:hypothetical protein